MKGRFFGKQMTRQRWKGKRFIGDISYERWEEGRKNRQVKLQILKSGWHLWKVRRRRKSPRVQDSTEKVLASPKRALVKRLPMLSWCSDIVSCVGESCAVMVSVVGWGVPGTRGLPWRVKQPDDTHRWKQTAVFPLCLSLQKHIR